MVLSGRLQLARPLLRWGAGIGVASLLSFGAAYGREAVPVSTTVSLSELPSEARVVDRRIHSGGPFAFPKDGIVFANRERSLPPERRGFYHEYTVATPGARNRGARRIVCGGNPPQAPQACYYTGDHYANFKRITP